MLLSCHLQVREEVLQLMEPLLQSWEASALVRGLSHLPIKPRPRDLMIQIVVVSYIILWASHVSLSLNTQTISLQVELMAELPLPSQTFNQSFKVRQQAAKNLLILCPCPSEELKKWKYSNAFRFQAHTTNLLCFAILQWITFTKCSNSPILQFY